MDDRLGILDPGLVEPCFHALSIALRLNGSNSRPSPRSRSSAERPRRFVPRLLTETFYGKEDRKLDCRCMKLAWQTLTAALLLRPGAGMVSIKTIFASFGRKSPGWCPSGRNLASTLCSGRSRSGTGGSND
jgi:hypothetical protein